MKHSRLSIQDLCSVALCTAIIAVLAQLSIPMPLGVPATLQTFAIILAATILGSRKGALAALIYVLLGAIGLPIFHNFTGGFQIIFGPTGGFLLSFPVMAYIVGYGIQKTGRWMQIFTVTAGLILNHAAGVAMFCLITKGTLAAALTACVIPFLPTTILQAILGSMLGNKTRRRLGASNLF